MPQRRRLWRRGLPGARHLRGDLFLARPRHAGRWQGAGEQGLRDLRRLHLAPALPAPRRGGPHRRPGAGAHPGGLGLRQWPGAHPPGLPSPGPVAAGPLRCGHARRVRLSLGRVQGARQDGAPHCLGRLRAEPGRQGARLRALPAPLDGVRRTLFPARGSRCPPRAFPVGPARGSHTGRTRARDLQHLAAAGPRGRDPTGQSAAGGQRRHDPQPRPSRPGTCSSGPRDSSPRPPSASLRASSRTGKSGICLPTSPSAPGSTSGFPKPRPREATGAP